MAILNASPESFSGGVVDESSVLAAAKAAVDDGAAIIDIGGQSLRTDQAEISVDQEVQRVVPLIETVRNAGLSVAGSPVGLSVDTYRASVAAAALDAGADLINDVSGLADPGMVDLVARSDARIVISFNPARPKTGPKMVELDSPVEQGLQFFTERLEALDRAGVDRTAVVVDPGPDLGKSPWATLQILRKLELFRSFGCPLLLALSRKDFLGAIVQAPPLGRDAALFGVLSSLELWADDVLRVHEPAAVADFYRLRAVTDGVLDVDRDLQLDVGLRHI